MIVFNIDVMLARRKMSLTELSERVGITMANLSILKTGKAKAVRVETLNKLCHALDCQPGDLLEYRPGRGSLKKVKRDRRCVAAPVLFWRNEDHLPNKCCSTPP